MVRAKQVTGVIFVSKFKSKRKRGFTLVEVIVSIVLVFAAMLSSFQVLTYGFKHYATSKNKVASLKIGQAVAEEILKLPYRVFDTQASPPLNLGNGTNGARVVITDNNYFPDLAVPNVDMSSYRLVMSTSNFTTSTTSGNNFLKLVTIQIIGPVDAAGNDIPYKTISPPLEVKVVVSNNKY